MSFLCLVVPQLRGIVVGIVPGVPHTYRSAPGLRAVSGLILAGFRMKIRQVVFIRGSGCCDGIMSKSTWSAAISVSQHLVSNDSQLISRIFSHPVEHNVLWYSSKRWAFPLCKRVFQDLSSNAAFFHRVCICRRMGILNPYFTGVGPIISAPYDIPFRQNLGIRN